MNLYGLSKSISTHLACPALFPHFKDDVNSIIHNSMPHQFELPSKFIHSYNQYSLLVHSTAYQTNHQIKAQQHTQLLLLAAGVKAVLLQFCCHSVPNCKTSILLGDLLMAAALSLASRSEARAVSWAVSIVLEQHSKGNWWQLNEEKVEQAVKRGCRGVMDNF